MSRDTVTLRVLKESWILVPAQCPQAAGRGGAPGSSHHRWGGRGVCPSSVPRPPPIVGSTPVCSPFPPPPPRNLVLELEGKEECAKYSKAAAGAREVAGAAGASGGSEGLMVPGNGAETQLLPPPALPTGGPGLRRSTREGQRHPGPVVSGRGGPWL